MRRYKQLFDKRKFSEKLTLSDLMKDKGISTLTKKWKKDRTGKIGAESKNAKLVDVKINREDDYIDFAFITIVTPYPEDPEREYGEIDPPDWDIEPNVSKKYEMVIRVLDFFSLLDTTPEDIKNQDIQDVIEIANIKVSCTCPAYNWQGVAHQLTQMDAAIYEQPIPDPIWGPRHNNDHFLCKHLQGLITNIKFFVPQMRQMIVKEVK